MLLHTIGHSTRSAADFLSLLETHGIRQLADVRTVPRSKRHPQFTREALDSFLANAGIVYRHFPELGGLRKPRPDSINTAWRHPGFRGYADYMQTDQFRHGVEALERFATASPTAVMCAEAVWWQCHRRLLADTLFVRGVEIRHILSTSSAKPHELSDFARESGEQLIYPGLL